MRACPHICMHACMHAAAVAHNRRAHLGHRDKPHVGLAQRVVDELVHGSCKRQAGEGGSGAVHCKAVGHEITAAKDATHVLTSTARLNQPGGMNVDTNGGACSAVR